MSKVKSKDTSIELLLRKELWKRGFRYRLQYPLPGKPDLVFPKYKIAVFVDGCFWHGCPICNKKMPSSNKEYWKRKIKRNIERDRRTDGELSNMGWRVIRVWEHQIKRDFENAVNEVVSQLNEKKRAFID